MSTKRKKKKQTSSVLSIHLDLGIQRQSGRTGAWGRNVRTSLLRTGLPGSSQVVTQAKQ